MKTYYGLSTNLVWLKIDNPAQKAEDFVIILDEENFVKILNQASELIGSDIRFKVD